MSVASEADPERGEGSAWVAAVAAQRGGDVDWPAQLSTPMTRLRKAAITLGAAPVRTWEPSSVKVVSRGGAAPRPSSGRAAGRSGGRGSGARRR
jgi:hypothetical protein